MKIGLFPKPPPAVLEALKGTQPISKIVTDYCFKAVGRRIEMQGVQFGAILQVRVLTDYEDPKTHAKSRRCYAVVQVFPQHEAFAREVLRLAEAKSNGVLDMTQEPDEAKPTG